MLMPDGTCGSESHMHTNVILHLVYIATDMCFLPLHFLQSL